MGRLAVSAATGLVAALAIAASAVPAAAQRQPVPASISALSVTNGAINGVLSLRGGSASVSPDAATLKAKVGAQAVVVKARPAAQSQRSVMLVVDTSGSMGANGMTTVREAVKDFLAAAPRDVSVGLTSFATTAGVDVAPTKDRVRVQNAVDALRSRGETTLYDGVAAAVAGLGMTGDRSIILLSDGGDTRSTKATKASATAALKRAGVRAEVIGFKTGESDNGVLRGFASAGGGSVAAAGDSSAVSAAFRAAAAVLDSQVNFSITVPAGLGSTQPVELSGTAGGRSFVAKGTVNLGAVAQAPTQSPTPVAPLEDRAAPSGFTAGTSYTPQLLLGLGATFLGILVLALALAAPAIRSRRRDRAASIEQYVGGTNALTEKVASVSPGSITTGLVGLGDRVMDGRESTSRTMALIERADLALRAGEWWVLRLVSVVLGVALVMVLLRGGLLMTIAAAVLGAVLGYGAPAVILRFLAKRRSKAFESQLPDVLGLVASSLTSGFSLLQALDAVAKDAAEPIAKEFSRALAETRIGSDVSDALDKMATRMDSPNMRWTTMAIRIQREVGGNLAETLRTTAKTLREREELHRHVRALSAEGRLSAYILLALPIGIFLYTVQTNREYVEVLWTHPIGWALLAVGMVSMTIGTFWMRKVVDVQV